MPTKKAPTKTKPASKAKKVGNNVSYILDGDQLTIHVDLSLEFGKSASGKTIQIASTRGNVVIEGSDEVSMGINIYKYAD